jgi:hypothetical protein
MATNFFNTEEKVMSGLTVAGYNQKFWEEDCLQKVSPNKVKGGESFQAHYLRLVAQAFQQEGAIMDLETANKELSERVSESAGRVEVLTFQVGIRDEVLATPPDELVTYIARLGEELRALEETDVPAEEADAKERQARIDQLGVKLELAQVYQKVVGSFVQELTETSAAVKRGAEDLERAQRQFEEQAQALRERIMELERDGLPAHTDEIQHLKRALQEKTEEFLELETRHRELVNSSRQAEELLSKEVESLRGKVRDAREAQRVAEQALLEQQTANEELKAEHIRLTQVADEAAVERERELREQLDAMREQNAQLKERVRVLEEAPEADVQLKAEMLYRVAVAVLGVDPDLDQLEGRVGEHMQAEGRLNQLYDLAHIPRGGVAFDALVGMIQSVAHIFTTWGRGDAQSLAVYAAHFEPNVAEINRKADDYDRVERDRADAVRDLGVARLDLVREQANSKKLLSILGNGFSWTWSTTTAVPRFIYDAMRF